MVPASRERRGGVRSFIGRAGSAGAAAAALSQPGHRKTPEARTTATVAAKAAAEVTAAQKTFPTLVFFLAHSLSLRFSLSLSLALFNPLHRVSRSTFLRCVHVGDTTTLSGRSGSLQRAPSESIPPISPPPSSSSISDQQGL